VRFKRNLLVGMAAAGCVVLAGSAWLALRSHNEKPGLPQQVNVRPEAKPEAITSLPSGYDKVKLGAPLPGDLGPGIVAREKALGLSPTSTSFMPNPEADAARAERMRLAQQARQAAESGVFVPIANTNSAPTTQSVALPSSPVPASGSNAQLSLDLANDQNNQGHKLSFLQQKEEGSVYNPHTLEEPASPYEVMAGSVIAASLQTGLNSDLPGDVIAFVSENVYDTVTGDVLLIPQGARLFGHYDSVVAFGQSRSFVVWQRIILPDGSNIVIDNMPATDPAGYAGLEDQVDYHTWTLLKGIAMSTLLGVGTQVTFGSNNTNLVEAIRESATESTNQAGQRIVEKDINIQPTLEDRPGLPLRVLVSKDIMLKPYEGNRHAGP
jgi:type IV secretion system protein VirB10